MAVYTYHSLLVHLSDPHNHYHGHISKTTEYNVDYRIEIHSHHNEVDLHGKSDKWK